jgi:glutathione S-transferase
MPQEVIQKEANLTLGYWGIRGLAQPIRSLLVCADVPFSEVRLGVFQDGTLMNEEEEDKDWEQVRSTLEIPFPNLPYLIDESVSPPIQLTQSNAILRYLARRFDYYGSTEPERVEIDVLQDEAYDFRNQIIKTAYTLGDSYTEAYDSFTRNIVPKYLDRFEGYLAARNNNRFFVGDQLSLADFVLYELLWQMTQMVPLSISESNRPMLFAYLQHFESIPQIAAYRQSDHYIERPINSPWASFA